MKQARMLVISGSVLSALAVGLVPKAVPEKALAEPATIEIAEKERRSCVTCHTAFGRPQLNAAGEYYKEEGTLEGYPGDLPPREGEPAPEPEPEPQPPTPQR